MCKHLAAGIALRAMPNGRKQIDYAMLSHFHGDHMGTIVDDSPWAKNGQYRLSGITEVAEHVPLRKVIDIGWPDYDYPRPLRNVTMDNYRRFLNWQARHNGLQIEQFGPGRTDQIVLLNAPNSYPNFVVQNIYSNGELWTGHGAETRMLLSDPGSVPDEDLLTGNGLSAAFRISYGEFDYFAGGDLSSFSNETMSNPPLWHDVESAVGLATGPVDVMKANHHGSWDSNSIGLLAALRPRAVIVTSRADGHPSVNTWKRLTSRRVWPGERDIFVTAVSEATAATTYGIDAAKSKAGHVVIRVTPGGESYRIIVLTDRDESMRVDSIEGPYKSH